MTNPRQTDPTPEQLVADLVLLLNLEPRGDDRFVGPRRPDGTGRVYGGQAIAQALGAARRTVDMERDVHSLHAYFLRGGSDDLPIDFKVERDFDGRSFSNRRVVASQENAPILNLVASFQKPQQGPEHQQPTMPDVTPPEDLRPGAQVRRAKAERLPEGAMRRLLLRPLPFDLRSAEPRDWDDSKASEPRAHLWFRTVAPLPDDETIHRAVLAYVSDFQLLTTAMLPHTLSFTEGDVKAASLDHAIWFHDGRMRCDEWMLYSTDSPWAGHARGMARGQIFTREGRLVASVAQEGMLRVVKREA